MEHKNLSLKFKLAIIAIAFSGLSIGQVIAPFSNLPVKSTTDTTMDRVVGLHWNGSKYENAAFSPGTLIKKAIISGAITGTGTNHYLSVWISANKQAIGYLYQGLNKIILPNGISIASGDSVASLIGITGSHPGWGVYSHGDKSHPYEELKSGSAATFGYDSVNAITITSNATQIQHSTQISLTSPYVFIQAADTFYNKGYTKATRGGINGYAIYDSSGWNAYKPFLTSDSAIVGSSTVTVTNGTPKVVSIPSSVALAGSPTTTTQSAGDNSTMIATTAYVKSQNYLTGNQSITLTGPVTGTGATAIATSIGAGSITNTMLANPANNQRVGNLVSDNFTAIGDSTKYTKTLASAVTSFNSGYVQISGGNGTYGNYIVYNYQSSLGSFLENNRAYTKFISTSNGTGAGIALKNNGNEYIGVFIDLSSGGTRGQIKIINPVAPTTVATSSLNLSYTNTTDTIQLEIRMINRWSFVAIASNLTSPSNLPVTVTYNYAPNGTFSSRVYQPAILTLGGTQKFTQLGLSSDEKQNPELVLMGNSITTGTGSSLVNYRSVSQIQNAFLGRSLVWASGGNKIADLTNNYSELNTVTNGQHYFASVEIGVNDVINGRTDAQILSDYQALVKTIHQNGGTPILWKIPHLGSAYSGYVAYNIHIDTLNARIGRMYEITVDVATLLGNPNTYTVSDGVHMNDAGQAIEANVFIQATYNVLHYSGWTYQYDVANGYMVHRTNSNTETILGVFNDNTGSSTIATQEVSAGSSCVGRLQALVSSNKVNLTANGSGGLNIIGVNCPINFFTGVSGATGAAHFDANQTLIFESGNITQSNIRANTAFFQSIGSLSTLIGDNCYYDGANFRAIATGAAAFTYGSNGKYYIYRAASVSAGATQTPQCLLNGTSSGVRIGDATASTYACDVTGDLGLTTAGNALRIKQGSGGMAGQTTLVSGTKAITISGLTTSDLAFVTISSVSGSTTGVKIVAACTSNTLTITSETAAGITDTGDVSVINYFIVRPY